jgi:beta-galactosidase
LKKRNNASLKQILTLYGILLSGLLWSQPGRIVNRLNDNWEFTKDNYNTGNSNAGTSIKWEPVHLPHTWNTDDVLDDTPGYYRGIGWYKKKLFINKSLQGKQLYLFFEGANQVTEVFINGQKMGAHMGGYSGFYVPITHSISLDKENELLVKVDNSFNQYIPPLSADFTFYGGIYRDVWLIAVDPIHFSLDDHGSNSVYITTPSVCQQLATVNIRSAIAGYDINEREVKIKSTIRNNKDAIVATSMLTIKITSGNMPVQQTISIKHPNLWSPESPYLYKVRTEISDAKSGKLLDAVTNPLGFRWFNFDAAKGFFLNGKSYKLVGTSRHQDYKGMGNAVPPELARKDVEWLKKMGGNFLRVAHYPQDPVVLQTCDSLGILASVEVPIVNEITESDTFYNNCHNMQVEMIRQNFNHPSVITWCYMNEVLLRSHYNNDKEKQKKYYAAITRLAQSLDSLTRKEDPSRYTMIAYHGDYNRYRDIGLVDIPMIAGWNLYSGWYGAQLKDFPAFLDAFHKDYPDKPMVISEYGADADPRIRSMEPVRFDKSVEYSTLFHQYYLTEMLKRPFVAAAIIWNLADFNSETRTESMPHINNKGLMTWDRIPKDPYYYYQAMLSKTPFVKILGAQASEGVADSGHFSCIRPLQVAANIKELELIVNGKSAGKQLVENGLCEWKVPFINGDNRIEVKGKKNGELFSDKAVLSFCLLPYRLDNTSIPFHQMNILLGANRYFIDEEQQTWIPDQQYHEGSWGYVGGKNFKVRGNNRLPYGTDKNIAGTNDDPVYQTQRMGIEKYKLDLPAGEYELTLHFAELLGGQVKELAYNLSDSDRIEPNGERIFNVWVNGKLLLENFNIMAQYGAAKAVIKKVRLTIENNKGIEIDFKATEGEPVLNALQVKKIDDTAQPSTPISQ